VSTSRGRPVRVAGGLPPSAGSTESPSSSTVRAAAGCRRTASPRCSDDGVPAAGTSG